MKTVKMTDYDVLVDKTKYPLKVYDPHTKRTTMTQQVVETMKRFNKNVTYKLTNKIAERLLGQGKCVAV